MINVSRSSTLQNGFQSCVNDSTSSDALKFVLEHLGDAQGLFKLLLPLQSGYIFQSDFLERRMVDCLNVDRVKGFVTPGQQLEGRTTEAYQAMNLSDLLPYCYGALKVEKDGSAYVNEELVNRLSFPWLSHSPVARKLLALLGGGSLLKFGGYHIAAASLNIGLVVVMSTDEHLLSIIAYVAEQLGFETAPAKSVAIAQNKFQTRQLDITNIYCRLVKCPADLERLLAEDGPRLEYPLIVKPSKDWSSEGIWKVDNEEELRHRVPMLWQDSLIAWHGRDVVIETFIEGPEVDANMVLVNGQVVFFEANDDFPSTRDVIDGHENDGQDADRTSAPMANFVKTSNVLPCHYAETADVVGSGRLIDLEPKTPAASTAKPVDILLVEIHPRAPDFQECEATGHAYGFCYYILSYHLRMELIAAEKGGIYRIGDVCTAILQQAPHLHKHVVKFTDPKTGIVYGNFIAYILAVSRTDRRDAIRVGHELRCMVREYTNGF
ncbi:uncharacterized protein BCR38DRAFT_459310 [Pseudomassariella vexata]|uniref:ATP-grasp domain-containing protein n=1 Tax=Pseudomassariella vexata TaxID=1141098 RepID=A0A1Y2DRW4_9PEZI|nr:uncharacterized protein BCR38DRAFT_459310 [Pseudomassariella vexata]ORY61425.1 hypothetical protein BCR38DRAFT_459310 [Pseudomassariella vexata]